LFGGRDHHTDPGPYWKWGYYLRLVRQYARPDALKVSTTTIDPGATLRGIVPWRAATKGAKAARVDFLVDGRVVWRDARKPFAFAAGRGLNTTTLPNGTHVLTVRAVGAGHAAQRLVVDVSNHEFALTTSALHPWQKVKGTLRVRAMAWGAKTTGIGLYVDGHVISRDRSAPYSLRWNTQRVHDGRHRITLIATSVDGRVARRHLSVIVKNHVVHKKTKPVAKPAPKPSAPPQITAENLADGQTVSAVVDWRIHTIGPVARVEFVVDGTVFARETAGPWGTSWDATSAAPGPHTLEARAYTRDGQRATAAVTVTVAPPPPQ
jgi:hypothetical protein